MSALQLAQLDTTGRTVTAIVFGLLVVAAALALLTAWYWRVTDPRRSRSTIDPKPPDRPPGEAPPVAADPDPDGAEVAAGPPTPVGGQKPDETAVLVRRVTSQESGGTPSRVPPEPSTHRTTPARHTGPVDRPHPGAPGLASPEGTGDLGAPPGSDELVIDLRDERRMASPDTGDSDDEDGLSFEEWLALAEEDS